jgi:hypothetical protein
MPVYRAFGNVVVSDLQLRDDAEAVARAVREGQAGRLGARDATGQVLGVLHESAVAFTPIGLYKPLTIQIRHVYTGAFPRKAFFSGRKDMLLTSAMKSLAVFNAAPRAVNFLKKDATAGSNFNTPAANEQGTPLVFYSPAITAASTIVTFEMIFDEFPGQLVERLGTALGNLSAIPVFLPANGYLVAASTVIKLASGLGEAIFDGRPVFSVTETLDFDVPGSIVPSADFRVICNAGFDPTRFDFEPNRGLVDRQTGQPYAGDEPYVVISLDGAKRDEYEGFTATMAGAALLERFYNLKEGSEVGMDTLIESTKLFTDSKFRAQADAIGKTLASMPADSDEARRLRTRRDALLANILSPALKPSEGVRG